MVLSERVVLCCAVTANGRQRSFLIQKLCLHNTLATFPGSSQNNEIRYTATNLTNLIYLTCM